MKMTDKDLLPWLQSEEQDAVGYWNSDVSAEQEDALEYYYGEEFGDEVEGRSRYVSQDVAEVVDWLMPDLIRVFMSGKEAVYFEPNTGADERFADQATDYVNHIFWKDNDGFALVHEWFKTALIQKIGILKVYWDDRQTTTINYGRGLTIEEIQGLEEDKEVEIVEATENEDGTFDVKMRRTRKFGRVALEGVAPEEFLISRRAKNMDDANYKAQRSRKRRGDLIAMGFDRKVIENLPEWDGNYELDTREEERFSDEDTTDERGSEAPGAQEVVVLEEYINIDRDDDGIGEMLQVIRVGNTILRVTEVDTDPFCSLCPYPIPYKFYGQSMADKTMDLQRLKSVLVRQILDNLYQTNNTRIAVDGSQGAVNLDDLLTNRPNAIIRTDGPPHDKIMPFQVQAVAGQSYNMIEYVDTVKEARTGITRYNQGMDADSLNKTASGITKIMAASQGRKDMIARIFAETGVREMFKKILNLVVSFQDKPRMIRLRKDWVAMDPRKWNVDMAVSVNVGVGTGDRDQKLQHLAFIAGKQEQVLLTAGDQNPMVGWAQLRATYAGMVEAADVGEPETFFKKVPTNYRMPQQGDPNAAKDQAAMQAKQMEIQANMQMKGQELQLDQMKAEKKYELERQELELKRQELDLERQRVAALEAELEFKIAEAIDQKDLDEARLVADTAIQENRMQLDAEKREPKTEKKLRMVETEDGFDGSLVEVEVEDDD